MIDFDLWQGEPMCRGYAWEWLRARADARREVRASLSEMARTFGWSKPAVQRFVRHLEQRGLIRRTDTGADTGADTSQKTIIICRRGENKPIPLRPDTPADTPADTPSTPRKGPCEDTIREAVRCYRLAAERRGWSQPKTVSGARKQAISARLREHGLDGWKDMLRQAMKAPLFSENERGWRPNLDWFAKAQNFQKVLEGVYAPQQGKPAGGKSSSKLLSEALRG